MRNQRVFRLFAPVLLLMAGLFILFQLQAQRSVKFIQLCDPQLGMGGYRHDSIALVQAVAQINEIGPDFVVICGDLVHHANDASYSDLESILSALEVPYFAAPGNHDMENNPTPESLEYYRSTVGADYFLKDTLDYAFVFVNSTLWMAPLEAETEKQDTWLNGLFLQLAEKKSPVFLIGHHPLFIKSLDEPASTSSLPPDKRTELLTLLSTANVIGYLSGHDHRTVINQHIDIQLVSGETTSINFDKRPLGFRLWHVTETSATHDFIPLDVEDI